MWNRVVLLCCGVAFGWNLVNYWSVPIEKKHAQVVRLMLALSVAMLIIVWIGLDSLQAALVGAFVCLFSALVSYAGNAKQVSKPAFLWPLTTPIYPDSKDDRCVVLLASEGEPRRYIGAKPWAAHFRAKEDRGEAIPHWFTRPLAYARIRAAYDAMGGENSFNDSISYLAKTLAESLGTGYVVEDTYLRASPELSIALLDFAKQGFTKIILLPIELDLASLAMVREEATRSRVREFGVDVKIAAPFTTIDGLPKPYGDRLQQLLKGEAPPPPPEQTEHTLEILREKVKEAGA